ncbi:MAG: nucleotidyltransferase [Myxococcales bacterium]|nr:nucleotidyltransferase [Myxococcales bacterium]
MNESVELNDDFRDMLEALVASDVDFVIVGAHALAAHGLPRATGDIDILVRPTEENAERVLAALAKFGAPLEAHGVSRADFSTPGRVYQIGLPPRRIDLLTEISGVSFEDAWAGRVTTSIGGVPVSILGRDSLVKNKRATGRDKDLLDVRALTRTRSRGPGR